MGGQQNAMSSSNRTRKLGPSNIVPLSSVRCAVCVVGMNCAKNSRDNEFR